MLVPAITVLVVTACAVLPAAGRTEPGPASASSVQHICTPAPAGYATCAAQTVVAAAGKAAAAPAHKGPAGYGPAELRSAYALSATAGSGRTVAVVGAYDDPTADADLAVYRRTYGLPACTSANGCFRKVSQIGTKTMPARNTAWGVETSLDLDMVSASCSACRILLVESATSSATDLSAAVDYAATQRVSAISTSYTISDARQDAAYNHPGIAITAATGDGSYGITAPASYDTVIAVGGTRLVKAANARGWTETAWAGSGSGCSSWNTKPVWQTTRTQCNGKATADVSAVADPGTGVAVYDSTRNQGFAGWRVLGGTSAASPFVAGVYAMSGRTAGYPAAYTWAHAAALNDVTRGGNGRCPQITTRWCTAGTGWDGPTGLGTPRGTTAF
jgi:subtilase family serine protease